MGVPRTQQFTVVAQSAVDTSQAVTQAAFFGVDGAPYLFPVAATTATPGLVKKMAAVADIATPDGSDAGTTQTLANALKVKVNALLVAARTAGQLT